MSIIGLNFQPGDSLIANALGLALTAQDPSGKTAESMKAAIKAATIRAIGRVSSDFRKDLYRAAKDNSLGWEQKSPLDGLLRANRPAPQPPKMSAKNVAMPLKPTRLLGKMIPAIRYTLNTESMLAVVGFLSPSAFDEESITRMEASKSLPSTKVGRIGYWFQAGGQYTRYGQDKSGQKMSAQTRKYFGALGLFDPERRRISGVKSSAGSFQRPQRQLVGPVFERTNIAARLQVAFLERLARMTANG